MTEALFFLPNSRHEFCISFVERTAITYFLKTLTFSDKEEGKKTNEQLKTASGQHVLLVT